MKPTKPKSPIGVYLAIFLSLFTSYCFSQISYSNNYTTSRTFVNVSKHSGGTFNPNDTIEVRYTIYLPQSPQPIGGGGASQVRNILKSAKLIDTLPTGVSYVYNSLRILTNEAVLYKGPFTAAADADQGDSTVSGTNRIITIRARPSTGPALDTLHGGFWDYHGGTWTFQNNTSIPKWSNAALCMITYRVKVTASYGQFLTFNKSALRFQGVADAAPVAKFLYPRSVIAVYQTTGLCSNGLDLSELFETNGSFGSGKVQNRATASTIIPGGGLGYNFVANAASNPVDGNYSVVNNSSALGSKDTTKNGPISNAIKVFNVWDVFGDHTGATSSAYGNAPVDTAAAKPGGGYMLLVNASYATNAAVSQVVNNVCKNTYYEFSAWFRNICPLCSGDSLGVSPGAGYKSYPGNDSAGVRPNLAFEINDTTYFTTGDIAYAKTKAWLKKGFTFLNNLDSFKITIRNNSPGGGGNDWAVDDVSVSTCGPTLTMNYSPFLLGCSDTGPILVNLHDTVRYIYNNSYVYYRWERSTNAGVTWTTIAGTTGVAIPLFVSGQWTYVANYTFLANGATDSGYRYRVVVATTSANLSSGNCAYTDGSYTYLKLLKCGSTLISKLETFSGILTGSLNNKPLLSWTSTYEKDLDHYDIERSNDGRNFYKTGEVMGKNLNSIMNYQFRDAVEVNGSAFYRLKMVNSDGLANYSNTILLSTKDILFNIDYVNNPFTDKLRIDYIVPGDGATAVQFFDAFGKLIFTKNIVSSKGFNSLTVPSFDNLSAGIYVLKIIWQNNSISKKIAKFN